MLGILFFILLFIHYSRAECTYGEAGCWVYGVGIFCDVKNPWLLFSTFRVLVRRWCQLLRSSTLRCSRPSSLCVNVCLPSSLRHLEGTRCGTETSYWLNPSCKWVSVSRLHCVAAGEFGLDLIYIKHCGENYECFLFSEYGGGLDS